MDEKNIFSFSREIYTNYKNIFKKLLDDLTNFKFFEYGEEIMNLIKVLQDDEFFVEYLLIINYPKWLSLSTDFIINENNYNINQLDKIIINVSETEFNNKFYKKIIYMFIYLLSKIDEIIVSIAEKYDYINYNKFEIKRINQLYQTLIQIMFLMAKFYIEKIYDLNKIFLLINIIIFFITKNRIMNDKYIKIKNIILFELLIEKYFIYFTKLILNNKEDNKGDIILLFNYILKVFNSQELKMNYNYEIITKNGIIINFIEVLLNNIDYIRNIDIYNKYKEDLINCLTNVYKNNTGELYFFEKIINQNKTSFINLVNFQTKKDNIIKDFYIQNFYIELLNQILYKQRNDNSKIKSEENYFKFNGYNSKMTFDLKEFNLNNSFIFFSFYFLNDNNTLNIFPLINFESQSGRKIIFKLYIQKENNINKLMFYQGKDEKKKKIRCLEKIGNIQLNSKYIISIRFTNKKLWIYLLKQDEKNEKYFEENEIIDVDINAPILKIGHDDKNNQYFKGYIGSFIILKELKNIIK